MDKIEYEAMDLELFVFVADDAIVASCLASVSGIADSEDCFTE